MSILWWEKTVEYFFVQKYVDIDMFIAPLDGNQEKGGDAIFANESSWILIEFKRDQESISSEIKKFTNFSEAKKTLEPKGKHHLIIYGLEDNDEFHLHSQEYFSEEKIDIEKALLVGTNQNNFIDYLKQLVSFKKQSKSGSGGYSLVAGISKTGKVTKCMKIPEFAEALKFEKALKLKLENQQEQTNDYTPPSPGRW
ncbi:hypothetical protein AB6D20_021185 [Vibrio splendidus]